MSRFLTTELDHTWSSIIDAIYASDVEAVRTYFAQRPELIHYKRGDTWLHSAAHAKSVPMIDFLVSLGCDVNAEEDGTGRETPLKCAVIEDDPTTVERLLKLGANPNHMRMVISAITGTGKHSLEMIKLLDQYGADLHKVFVNEYTGEPMNALSTAIDWGKEDVAEYLRSRGCVLPPRKEEPPVEAEVVPTLDEEVIAYFREHFGPVEKLSLIEIVLTGISISIHSIPPSPERRHVTLFTTGLSSHPMNVPEDEVPELYQRAELFIQLPADWKFRDVADPNYNWPQHWLRSMAQYPSQHNTWLGGAVTIVANDDPPQPLAPNTRFNSLLLMAERELVTRQGHRIQLYRMTPLYPEERELESREGIGALLRAFDRHSIPFIVDLNRPSVA